MLTIKAIIRYTSQEVHGTIHAMDLLSFTCPECGQYETTKLDSLRIHCQKKHHLPTRKLYALLFLHEGKEPTCACGCGEPTKFLTLQRGFSEYILGHAARVNNNWGHNKDALQKSLQKRRDEGLWSRDPWNRGKTKENDPKFAMIAERAYGSKEFRQKRSEIMAHQWSSGILTIVTGSAHPNWKGGTSALQPLVRSHLYRAWTLPKLKASGFKCDKCGSTKDLEVHHNGERFASILHLAILELGEPGDDFEKKHLISEWVADYHVEKNVSGIVLCEDCHAEEHKKIPAGLNSFAL